jgi:hypothetical protein
MKALLDAFWRAVAYCLHPRVIGLSLLPLLVGAGLAIGLAWWYWEAAVAAVRGLLESWALVDAALKWVDTVAGANFRSVVAPMLVVLLALPVVVVTSVLLVAWLMTPAIVDLVAARRFSTLERRHGTRLLGTVGWSLGCTLLALLALVVTLPLWLIPPMMLVLPPLIWGWLTYCVMSVDALAQHASADERRRLMQRHRWPLVAIGVISGYLGAAPTLLWVASAAMLVVAPLLIGIAVWLYTLIFAFSALWCAHYGLAALAALRAEDAAAASPPPAAPETRAIEGATPDIALPPPD